MGKIEDFDLVGGIKASDPACLKALVDIYAERLISISMSFGVSRQDSEEVVNDSFYKIVKNIKMFDPDRGCKFSTWIIRITINTAKDRLKQLQDPPISQSIEERAAKGIQDTETLWQESSPPDSQVSQLWQAIMVQALESLSETDQDILRCCACGIPQQTIAELLNKTTGAVKIAHHRAKERLKAKYLSILESFKDKRQSIAVKTYLEIEANNEKASN